MRIHILGAGAGGGFPQWNCNCRNCGGFRAGTLRASARTQSSIAVSADGDSWVLVNASPDIRAQIAAFPALQPGKEIRSTAVDAILLTDAQLDHTAGLLFLREGDPLTVYCTESVHQDLCRGFPVLPLLEHYCGVQWNLLLPDEPFQIKEQPRLRFTAIPLESKAPPYSPHRHMPHPDDNVGLAIEDLQNGRALFYAPGLGKITPPVRHWLDRADCLLVDGTFWREDEMEHAGVGTKTATAMGHLPLSGRGGMIEQLRPCRGHKILIHINNTNPILDDDSPERAQLAEEGIDVAVDGMEILL
jgi:pyrroloquinoline quinone biosynthesis protein B